MVISVLDLTYIHFCTISCNVVPPLTPLHSFLNEHFAGTNCSCYMRTTCSPKLFDADHSANLCFRKKVARVYCTSIMLSCLDCFWFWLCSYTLTTGGLYLVALNFFEISSLGKYTKIHFFRELSMIINSSNIHEQYFLKCKIFLYQWYLVFN